jgi:hypothetical protein
LYVSPNLALLFSILKQFVRAQDIRPFNELLQLLMLMSNSIVAFWSHFLKFYIIIFFNFTILWALPCKSERVVGLVFWKSSMRCGFACFLLCRFASSLLGELLPPWWHLVITVYLTFPSLSAKRNHHTRREAKGNWHGCQLGAAVLLTYLLAIGMAPCSLLLIFSQTQPGFMFKWAKSGLEDKII